MGRRPAGAAPGYHGPPLTTLAPNDFVQTDVRWEFIVVSTDLDKIAARDADKSFGAPVTVNANVSWRFGHRLRHLKATAKGTSTVVRRYSQPWLGGTSSEWTYTLTVTVR